MPTPAEALANFFFGQICWDFETREEGSPYEALRAPYYAQEGACSNWIKYN